MTLSTVLGPHRLTVDMFLWLQDCTENSVIDGRVCRLRCFVPVASPPSKRLSTWIKWPLHHDVSTRGRRYYGNHPSWTQWPLPSALKVATESKSSSMKRRLEIPCNVKTCLVDFFVVWNFEHCHKAYGGAEGHVKVRLLRKLSGNVLKRQSRRAEKLYRSIFLAGGGGLLYLFSFLPSQKIIITTWLHSLCCVLRECEYVYWCHILKCLPAALRLPQRKKAKGNEEYCPIHLNIILWQSLLLLKNR